MKEIFKATLVGLLLSIPVLISSSCADGPEHPSRYNITITKQDGSVTTTAVHCYKVRKHNGTITEIRVCQEGNDWTLYPSSGTTIEISKCNDPNKVKEKDTWLNGNK